MSLPTLRAARSGPPGITKHTIPSWVWKLVMAVTGAVWGAFVLVHLFGNLKIYFGPEAYDGYAEWLRVVGYPLLPHKSVLWALRLVLAGCIVLHVSGALILYLRARKARGPVPAVQTWAVSRVMLPTGILIAIFIIVHVLDLTIGAGVASESFVVGSAYANLVASLSRPWMGLFYTVIMLLIAAHLLHGVQLAFNDLGTSTHRWRQIALIVAGLVAVAIVLGNATIPLGILGGLIG